MIVEAELDLAENTRIERIARKMPRAGYAAHFREKVRNAPEAVFHNGDIYAPHYSSVRSVTWVQTKKAATAPYRLQLNRRAYPLENYFLWAITETPFGKWRREFLIDPLLYLTSKVHWRNFEAGYDVAELEPPSRKHRTYVLQEYFVPVERFDEFVPKMAEIFQRHRVNVLNVSIRHAMPDPGSLLAWARTETFAFVVYYKQRTRENARQRVAVWTRELIDAALERRRQPTTCPTSRTPRRSNSTAPIRGPPSCSRSSASSTPISACATCSGTSTTHPPCNRPRPPPMSGSSSRVPRRIRRRQVAGRVLPVPAERLPHLPGGSLPYVDQGGLRRAIARTRRSIGRPAGAARHQAVPGGAVLRAAFARQAEAGDDAADAGAAGGEAGYRRLRRDRFHRPLRERPAQAPALQADRWCWSTTWRPAILPVDIVERGQLGKLGSFVPLDDYAPIPASERAGRERRPGELLHRPASHRSAAAGRLHRFDCAHAETGRDLHPARPRRYLARDAHVRVAGSHRVQRRPGRSLGGEPQGVALLHVGRGVVAPAERGGLHGLAGRACCRRTTRPTTC